VKSEFLGVHCNATTGASSGFNNLEEIGIEIMGEDELTIAEATPFVALNDNAIYWIGLFADKGFRPGERASHGVTSRVVIGFFRQVEGDSI
jgi:hypothetical protein